MLADVLEESDSVAIERLSDLQADITRTTRALCVHFPDKRVFGLRRAYQWHFSRASPW